MGLLDFLKSRNTQSENDNSPIKISSGHKIRSGKIEYADSRSIAPDERQYYRPDDYYTTYSYPGTEMARRVITFEERKKTSYPSKHGLYVAEILLLEYCSYGKYPKPSSGYPGLWWFEYGIRDVGHALESLEKRGFLYWAPLEHCLSSLKVDELKQILAKEGLTTTGKKADLVKRISEEMPRERIDLPDSAYKYELTDLGKEELRQNGYVPYMHKHPRKTTEDARFEEVFNVWSINKLFPDGNTSDWRRVVGGVEEKLFGVDMATGMKEQNTQKAETKEKRDYASERDAIRTYLAQQKEYINKNVRTSGDGYAEEAKGLDLMRIGKDKEALVQFFIAIDKKFDAPALYREAAALLEKYEMFDDALYVIDKGLKNIPTANRHRDELLKRRDQIKKKLGK